MEGGFLAYVIELVQQNPVIALTLVFLVAMTESLIVVGLIVPGAVLMIVFGALISLGALSFWSVVSLAVIGAVAGDGLSYWLGRKYKHELSQMWPVRRYPGLLTRAESFFEKHGAKSIILSRFIGPLRPVIPAFAGIAGLPPRTFIIVNVASALAWAPLYLLPGIIFGLSLEIAGEFAQKFILFILTAIGILLLGLWLVRFVYRTLKPYVLRSLNDLLEWSRNHKIIGKTILSILDSHYRERYGLTVIALLLSLFTYLFYYGQNNAFYPFNFDSVDRLVFISLQQLQSPTFELVLSWLNYFASGMSLALLCFGFGFLLLARKDFHTLWHWIAAIALPLALSPLLSNSLTSILSQKFSFHFGTLAFIIIVSSAGFYLTIISTVLKEHTRVIFYYLFSLFLIFIAIAQLYFAEQVFSQVLFGTFIGITWFILLDIAYQKHRKTDTLQHHYWEHLFFLLILVTLSLVRVIEQPALHEKKEVTFIIGTNSWMESGWAVLPQQRKDIYNREIESFNLQWAGNKTSIDFYMKQLGFVPGNNTSKKFAKWFIKPDSADQLPLLPHVHNGDYEDLQYFHFQEENNQVTVIRLWQSQYHVKQESPAISLWFGSVNKMLIKENVGMNYLVTDKKREQLDIFYSGINALKAQHNIRLKVIEPGESRYNTYLVYEKNSENIH